MIVFLYWSQSVETGGGDCFFKWKDSNTRLQEYEKSRNMTPPKEHNNFSVSNLKEMESKELPDKEFKITFKEV